MLREEIKALQQIFIEEISKVEKGAETIQVLKKNLLLEKLARRAADNSTCFYSYNFEINTGKSQGNESVVVSQPQKTFLFRVWPKICQTDSKISFCRELGAFATVGTA